MARSKKVASKTSEAREKTALVLRCCGPEGESYGGFKWPLTVGEKVEAPYWRKTPECGNGLHGWLWGEGDLSVSERMHAPDAVWLVLEVAEKKIIDLRGKVKFPACIIQFVGKKEEAANFIIANGGQGRRVHFGTATAGDSGTATAGDCGTATAGYRGTATAGYRGTATAGDSGTLVIQYYDIAKQKYRNAFAEVGENGIKPDTKYRCENGVFVEVEETERSNKL